MSVNLPAGTQPGPGGVQLLPAAPGVLWVAYSASQPGAIDMGGGPSPWAARVLTASGRIVTNVQVAAQGLVSAAGITSAGNLKLLIENPAPTEATTPTASLVAACPNYSYFFILSPQAQLVYATYVPPAGFNFTQQNESTGPPAATIGCFASTAGRVPSTFAAPGELITITGGGFGPSNVMYTAPGADGKYPLTAAGYSVKIGGLDAPVIAVALGTIAVQVPFESPYQPLDIEVFSSGQLFQSIPMNPAGFNLTLFDTGDRNNPLNLPALAALNQDGTINSFNNPAAVGTIVSLFGSGAGILSPPLQTGALSPVPPSGLLSLLPSPLLAGCWQCSSIPYVGSAPGLTTSMVQINMQLPSSTPGSGVRPQGVAIDLAYSIMGLFAEPTGIVWVK